MTIIEVVAGAIVKKVIDSIWDRFSGKGDSFHGISSPEIKDRITRKMSDHMIEVERWARNVNFNAASKQKRTSKIFLELDAFVIPLSKLVSDSSEQSPVRGINSAYRETSTKTEPLLNALSSRDEHCVILGQAGAGKTTSIMKICDDFFNNKKILLNYNFPILVRFKDILPTPENVALGSLLYKIGSEIGLLDAIDYKLDGSAKDKDRVFNARRVVVEYLNSFKCALLLDGFDEISEAVGRREILKELEFLASALTASKLILTSRVSDFPYSLQCTKALELAPLTRAQIISFVGRWFDKPDDAKRFEEKLFSSPFSDTAARPLTIAHLCAIFEYTGKIPDKPKSVYRRLVRLLLEDWDAERNIRRGSRYAAFDTDRKEDFLAALSFQLTFKYKTTRFDLSVLKAIYVEMADDFNLPKSEAEQVAHEIESHSGLIIESSNRIFEFSHKSLQEYFCAYFIVRLPAPWEDEDRALLVMPNEAAIAVSLSSNSTKYFTSLVFKVLILNSAKDQYYSTFLSRLNLEKVDFVYSELAVVAACVVLSGAGVGANPRIFSEMMGGMYPFCLKTIYRTIYENENGVTYELSRSRPDNVYPKIIFLSKPIHDYLSMLPVKRNFD